MTTTVDALAGTATKGLAPFPHHYEVSIKVTDEGQCRICAGPRPELMGGPPAQFGGRDDWWSPEHLLLGAVSLCLFTTFRALAQARDVILAGYSSQVKGILDRTTDGPAFTSIVLDVGLTVPEGQKERAVELLERAKRIC